MNVPRIQNNNQRQKTQSFGSTPSQERAKKAAAELGKALRDVAGEAVEDAKPLIKKARAGLKKVAGSLSERLANYAAKE